MASRQIKELLSISQGPNEGKANQYIFLTFYSKAQSPV